MKRTRLLHLLWLLLLVQPIAAAAQLSPPEPESTATEPADPLQRQTPRSTVTALIRALAAQNYELAGRYFSMEEQDAARGASLARALQASLDAGGELATFADLSNDLAGDIKDGLPPDFEQVGQLDGGDQSPILLVRRDLGTSVETQVAEQGPFWQIAEPTITELEERQAQIGGSETMERGALIAGAPAVDWLILLGFLLGAFIVLRLLAMFFLWVMRRTLAHPDRHGVYRFLHAALPPFSLLLAAIATRVWGSEAPVAIVARQVVLRYIGIVVWIAIAWFAIRLVDAIAQKVTSKLDATERRQAASAVTLARRAAKLIMIAVAAVAILDTLGIDVTTGIAALGIGGLALALGAQKTVENLVGSVTVVADRPVQVGDFCSVGDVLGWVEDIGMRSTRIRTLNRTVVTIPNGDFSSRQIENYTRRDRFLFNPVIGLEYGLSAQKLREGLAIIEKALVEHPLIAEDPRRARLANFGPSSLDVEVFAYIEVSDYAESLAIREELLLTMFERLEDAGLAIAYPTQTLYLRPDQGSLEGK